MPTYVFRDRDDNQFELQMSVTEFELMPEEKGWYTLPDGRTAYVDVAAQQLSTSSTGWPIYSDAAGCHPEQIPEMRKHLSSHGAATEFTKDGRAIFRDRAHRKRALRALGLHDRSGGYGD